MMTMLFVYSLTAYALNKMNQSIHQLNNSSGFDSFFGKLESIKPWLNRYCSRTSTVNSCYFVSFS